MTTSSFGIGGTVKPWESPNTNNLERIKALLFEYETVNQQQKREIELSKTVYDDNIRKMNELEKTIKAHLKRIKLLESSLKFDKIAADGNFKKLKLAEIDVEKLQYERTKLSAELILSRKTERESYESLMDDRTKRLQIMHENELLKRKVSDLENRESLMDRDMIQLRNDLLEKVQQTDSLNHLNHNHKMTLDAQGIEIITLSREVNDLSEKLMISNQQVSGNSNVIDTLNLKIDVLQQEIFRLRRELLINASTQSSRTIAMTGHDNKMMAYSTPNSSGEYEFLPRKNTANSTNQISTATLRLRPFSRTDSGMHSSTHRSSKSRISRSRNASAGVVESRRMFSTESGNRECINDMSCSHLKNVTNSRFDICSDEQQREQDSKVESLEKSCFNDKTTGLRSLIQNSQRSPREQNPSTDKNSKDPADLLNASAVMHHKNEAQIQGTRENFMFDSTLTRGVGTTLNDVDIRGKDHIDSTECVCINQPSYRKGGSIMKPISHNTIIGALKLDSPYESEHQQHLDHSSTQFSSIYSSNASSKLLSKNIHEKKDFSKKTTEHETVVHGNTDMIRKTNQKTMFVGTGMGMKQNVRLDQALQDLTKGTTKEKLRHLLGDPAHL